ncbi:bifunctional riboflavin kinase/FAD synthetase [Pinisolibacter sp.]|uniref:bifunctional riboflavin kinase/FAD synthetase n=1 Tax=Pinisolibacter sp. TaxID=2172024 RepID=UPI002FDD698C
MSDPTSPRSQPFRSIAFGEGLPATLRGAHVAIGNFDGMHRGHQAVLAATLDRARAAGRPALALTFEPHPRSFFAPDKPVFRLTPPAAKARLASALGLDGLVVAPFDGELAALSADDFVARVLVDGLGLANATVGWDFHFGKGRSGSPAFLSVAGVRHGFGVDVVEPHTAEDGALVSSSRIRTALEAGDLAEAAGLLGYRWFVEGAIVGGDRRGRDLGFPTANMRLAGDCRLKHGVYAVIFTVDGVPHLGAANWGRRPQFDHGAPVLETHVLDFAGDLYGKTADVTFVSYLRPEAKFASLDGLIDQMKVDCGEARALLSAIGPGSALDRALAELRP